MSAWKLERHTENVWRSKLQIALTSGCRKDKTQGKVDWKSVTVKGNKQGARMRSDLPHPRATPMMASGGWATGKMKKWGLSSLFFHFRQCEETARTESGGKMRSIFAWKNLFFRIRWAVASSQKKRFQRERFIPLDARKRPRTYGKCYDSAATRSGLSKHVTRFSYPSPDRTQSIKKVVLVLTQTSIT